MLNYAYRAIDRDGNGVAGTLAAVDEQSLAEKLQAHRLLAGRSEDLQARRAARGHARQAH